MSKCVNGVHQESARWVPIRSTLTARSSGAEHSHRPRRSECRRRTQNSRSSSDARPYPCWLVIRATDDRRTPCLSYRRDQALQGTGVRRLARWPVRRGRLTGCRGGGRGAVGAGCTAQGREVVSRRGMLLSLAS
jgi:hypothetical protein